MKKYQRNILQQSDKTSQEYGVTAERFHVTKNKAYVLLRGKDGTARKVFCAQTPSDHRAMANHLSNIRHTCIAMTELAA